MADLPAPLGATHHNPTGMGSKCYCTRRWPPFISDYQWSTSSGFWLQVAQFASSGDTVAMPAAADPRCPGGSLSCLMRDAIYALMARCDITIYSRRTRRSLLFASGFRHVFQIPCRLDSTSLGCHSISCWARIFPEQCILTHGSGSPCCSIRSDRYI
jgi:hypothetical protein